MAEKRSPPMQQLADNDFWIAKSCWRATLERWRSPPNGPGVLHCERDSHVAGLISGRYPRPGMNRAVSPATPRSRGVRQAFNLVKLAEALIGIEKRGWECACKAHGLVLAQPLLRRAPAAENRYAAPQSDDLAPCPSFWGVRPGLLPLLEIKEDRHHLPHVIPVAGIVGLQKGRRKGVRTL